MKRLLLSININAFVIATAFVLGIATPARAQFSNTIIVPPFSINPITGISAAITNIGQSIHYYTVTTGRDGGHACNGTGYFTSTLQGSYDGTQFFTMPQLNLGAGPAPTSNTLTIRMFQASGVFPVIKVVLTGYDNTCTYVATYSGVLSGAALSPLTLGIAVGSGGGAPITAGMTSAYVQKSAPIDNIIINTSSGITDISVYSLSVCNVTAGQTVTFKVNSITIFKLNAMAAGQCYDAPISPTFPVLSTTAIGFGAGFPLVAALSAGTEVDFRMTYRFE